MANILTNNVTIASIPETEQAQKFRGKAKENLKSKNILLTHSLCFLNIHLRDEDSVDFSFYMLIKIIKVARI